VNFARMGLPSLPAAHDGAIGSTRIARRPRQASRADTVWFVLAFLRDAGDLGLSTLPELISAITFFGYRFCR
jgi:hypothetical protein